MGLLFDEKPQKKSKAGKGCGCIEDGCATCPLNRKKKIINIDRIKGRKIMVWAEAPGHDEEVADLELVGKSGQLFWDDAERAGFTRGDCDVQNVVRCRPTKISEYGNKVNRTPTKEEIWHCGKFTQRALTKTEATVHLVLGEVAAHALLGKEYRKGRQIFWSDRLQAKVVCTYHPAYFLREVAKSKRRQFRDALATVAQEALLKRKGRYAFVEAQDYKAAESIEAIRRTCRQIKKYGRTRTVVFDLEYGPSADDPEKEAMFAIGVCWKRRHTTTMFLDHPRKPFTTDRQLTSPERREAIACIREIMEDPSIKKSFHFGVSDDTAIQRILGIKVRGFTYDTHFAEYIAFSGRKAYGLAEIAEVRFPQFAGYKSILDPYKNPETGWIDFNKVPRKILTRYNGADCDLAKHIHISTRKLAPYPIVKTYTYASYTVEKMQRHGPLLDYPQYELVEKIIPQRVKSLEENLKLLARNPDFNPRSPQQVAKVMYVDLGIPKLIVKGKEQNGTALEILDELGLKYEFPRLMALFRRTNKMEDYLKNYHESALMHNGELRTIWWLAGTIAGRMRSGGDRKNSKVSQGLVNLQNIHGDPLIENMLVADPRWRTIASDFDITVGKDEKGEDVIKVKALHSEEYYERKYRNFEVFVAADYGQIEIRMLAHMSRDKRLIEIFNSGEDIHSLVGHDLTGRPVKEIAKDRVVRTMIKSTHFALVYGKKPPGIHAQILADYAAQGIKSNIKLKEIEAIYEKYFETYEGAAGLIKGLIEFARDHGYTETIFGFRREINRRDDERGTQWENQAVNSPIQGSAHMLEVIALALLHIRLKKFNRLQHLVMEVHDALYGIVKLRNLKRAQKQFKMLLEKEVLVFVMKWFGIKIRVPIVADVKAGFRLGAMTEYSGGTITEFLCSWIKTNVSVEKSIEKSVLRLKK